MKGERIKTASEVRATRNQSTKIKVLGIKILPSKKLLQRLSVLLAQLQAGNTSENLLKEIKQTVYLLHWAKADLKICVQ